jgi:glyoxylase-like metal-dependent hydrolase (beta-lactamase superfamily II)
MIIRIFTVGPVACNCCVVACPNTNEAVIIDPGGHPDRILAVVKSMGVKVNQIWHTHAHFDHILATGIIAKATGARIGLYVADKELFENLPKQGDIFGFESQPLPPPDVLWRGGETLTVGTLSAKVLHTPGHTPGSVGFYFEAPSPVLFSGDTLFSESIGRTDVTGGSYKAIVRSIREVLYTLPGNTRVIPGHGGETTIAHEREHNPFVTA